MTSKDIDISFIIPTYNRAGVVSRAIKSISHQTNPHWELIIVDDGSTDDTRDIIKEYLGDERIKYIFQKNSGVSVARNSGAKAAGGKYLIFLDSDDILFPELIDKLYKNNFIEYDLIFWQVIKTINNKTITSGPRKLGKLYNNLSATFLAGSICYRKEIFWNSGGYDPLMTFGENYELGIRISQIQDLKIKYIKEPFLKYTIDTETRTSNSFSNRLKSHLHQYEKHKKKFHQDRSANSTMNYLIGFIFEKTNKKTSALKYYRTSWLCAPWNIKPFLKILYLNIIK